MDHVYDLIVIGGGAAGLAAAHAGAAAKARTLLISEGEIGGECTFTGCVPSKTLIEAAARGAAFGAAMAAVRETVATIAATETGDLLTGQGIDVLRGHAEFASPRQVTVDGRTVEARGLVLATGSRPAIPPVPGLAGARYLTNENVFQLAALAERLAIVCGGDMGCELAQGFSRLGSRVTVIEAAPRLLPAADPGVSKVIGEVLAADGITVRLGAAVKSAEIIPNDGGCLLRLPGSATVAADRVLVATGRVPATDGLGLDAAGVRVDERGAVAVNRNLATTADGVYAAGDCTALMPFTHAAYAMGRIAARNALRRRWQPPGRFSVRAIPRVMFTDPEAAQVGLTEAQAAERARGAMVAHVPMREVDRAITAGRTEG